MTSQLRAPEESGADTRAKRPRTKTALPWVVVVVWVGLLVGGLSLAGKLDSVTRDGQVDYLPAQGVSGRVWAVDEAYNGHVELTPGMTADDIKAGWVDHAENPPEELPG
jgi:hypothetical protein